MAENDGAVVQRAGLAPGMRVLDVGCGRGDVELLAAKLIGAQGAVVGIDRDADAIELARGRVREMRSASSNLSSMTYPVASRRHLLAVNAARLL